MISFTINSSPIKRKLILFAHEPSLQLGLFDTYMQSFSKKAKFGFKRFPKYTKLIDISDDRFSETLSKQNIYKINRAKSEGVVCRTTTDVKAFVSFYNEFTIHTGFTNPLTEEDLKIFGNDLIVRVANLNDGPNFVYHTYLCDKSIKRVRCLHSASNIHDDSLTSQEKAVMGRANRYLHFDDMQYFRAQGFHTYDFGGYAYQTQHKSLSGINNFKDSFGGLMVEESNYESFLIYIIKLLLTSMKRITRIHHPVGKEG